MLIIPLRLVDPSTLDADDDIWAEACVSCGGADNCGHTLCRYCDD